MRATTMSRRMIETNITEEDIKLEGSLRPQTLDDYIGQQNSVGTHWIMCCSTAPLDLVRPPLPGSLPMRWESI